MKYGIKCLVMTLFIITLFTVTKLVPAWAGPPEIVGEAAVLVDGNNGQVLFAKNPHQRMYPASTTKILTAIIALENCRLDEVVEVPAAACNSGGSAIGLQEGEEVSLKDLLYALLLNSGNDAAAAIAFHVGGSEEDFARLMNQKAVEIGARNSHFVNPSGMPDANHYSTAYDLGLISRYAMRDSVFRKIVSTRSRVIERDYPEAQTHMYNSNRLLRVYPGSVGIKTGYTNDAGQCLISAAVGSERELIAVVLKSEGNNIWSDSTLLLDYGFTEFVMVHLARQGQIVTEVPVRFGVSEVVTAKAGGFLTYNFPAGNRPGIRQEVVLSEGITAPLDNGSKLGEVVYYADTQELGRVNLIAGHEVGRKWSAQWWPWFLFAIGLLINVEFIRRQKKARRKRWDEHRNRYLTGWP